MRRKMHITIFERNDLLEILEKIEKSINSTVLPALTKIGRLVKDKDVITEHFLFSKLDLKNDMEFFNSLNKIIDKYRKIIPTLKEKLEEDLPDTITSNSSNLNNKIALALISEGIFLATELPIMLSYMIERFYTKDGSEMLPDEKISNGNKLVVLIKMMPELKKAEFELIVQAVGNIPTLKTLREEEDSIIPVDLVMDFLGTTFSIRDFYTQTLTKRLIGFFDFKKENRRNKELAKNFIGNPIYHIRIFLVDLQIMRLNKYKEDVRLLELRILALQSESSDPKVQKAIRYYEGEINKYTLKIDKILINDRKR